MFFRDLTVGIIQVYYCIENSGYQTSVCIGITFERLLKYNCSCQSLSLSEILPFTNTAFQYNPPFFMDPDLLPMPIEFLREYTYFHLLSCEFR